MNIWSKNLLMSNPSVKYTLTVTTNPVEATCTLTADGVSSVTKTLTVDSGSIISYSVYHERYGTTTGSITMNADKTLSCTGTYDETEIEQAWSNPTMTSNQTPGGSVFAAFADSTYSTRYPHLVFDGQTGTGHGWQSNTTLPHYLGFYNPEPIKVTDITFDWYRGTAQAYSPKSGQLEASNDGSSYVTLQTFSYASNPDSTTFSNPTNNYYKYYRLYGTDGGRSGYYSCEECAVSGYIKISSYTYYWQTTIL